MDTVTDTGRTQRRVDEQARARGQPARRPHVRTVVCGIGGGEESREVARIAAELSARMLARLVLVRVAAPPSRAGSAGFPPSAQEGLHRSELVRAHDDLRGLLDDERDLVRAEHRVAFGSPAQTLGEVAREEGADLLVVGSRGRRGAAAALLGSVSAALVRSAPCPVVVVGPGARTPA